MTPVDWKDFIGQATSIVERYRSEAPGGFDPSNSFVAVAVGVVAAGATAYAASSASSSASDAQAQNAINTQNTNALNYNMFQQSRGANGSAIYPIYASPAEKQLYDDTLKTYNSTAGPSAADLQGIVNQNAGAQSGANYTVGQIFNGGLLQQDLANQQPVSAARNTAVATQKQGTLEALQQTLNNIKSIQAGKGFSGDSFGNQLLGFNARAGANTTAANAQSQANLANATDVNRIQSNDINRRLQNINVPGQMAQSNLNLATMGNTMAQQQQVQRQNLFSNFKIGTQAFQYSPMPQVNPVASTGQIIGQGVGAVAGSLGNYYANQNLASQYRPPNASGYYPDVSGLGTPAAPVTQFDPAPPNVG